MRVAIMGASLHTANRGVSALGASAAGLIWESQPDATVSLLIGNRDESAATLTIDDRIRVVPTVNYRLSPRAPWTQQLWCIVLLSLLYRVRWGSSRRWIVSACRWIRCVAESDLVVDIRGGDSFSDIYGLRNFLIDCLAVMSVIWVRGGIHLLPQTYGPFRSSLAKFVGRHILLRSNSILTRDRLSMEEVSRLTRTQRQATLCPDVAFALATRRPETLAARPPLPAARAGDTLIGLNVSGLVYYGGFTRSNMFGLRLDYREFLDALVARLLADPSNRILLVPHTFGREGSVESDPSASREVIARTSASLRDRLHLVTHPYDQHEIKGVIGMCDFFIGSRMHACIAALSQGIPTVGVAYSRKFAGVFETVGAVDWVVDGSTVEAAEALQRVTALFAARSTQPAALRSRVSAAKTTLARTFADLVHAHDLTVIAGATDWTPSNRDHTYGPVMFHDATVIAPRRRIQGTLPEAGNQRHAAPETRS